MADAGAIGVSLNLGSGVRVGAQLSGPVPATLTKQAVVFFKDTNRSVGVGKFPIQHNRSNVPGIWNQAAAGATKTLSRVAVVAGTANLSFGRKFDKSATSMPIVPNYWSLVGSITKTTTYNNIVGTNVVGSVKTPRQSITPYKFIKDTNKSAGVGVRSVNAPTSTTVPSYWSGTANGVRSINAPTSYTVSNYWSGSVAALRRSVTTYSYAKLSNVAAAPAMCATITAIPITVPNYWTGSVTASKTYNFTYKFVKDVNKSSASGIGIRLGASAKAVGGSNYKASNRSGYYVAGYNQFPSVSMILRKTDTSQYSVKIDMGYSQTLLRVCGAGGVPLHHGNYIGWPSNPTVRATINGTTITVNVNGSTVLTFNDTRAGAPAEQTTPGMIGFSAYKTPLGSFIADKT